MTLSHPQLGLDTATFHHDELLRNADNHRLAIAAMPDQPGVTGIARRRLGDTLVHVGHWLHGGPRHSDDDLTSAILLAR